MDSGLCRDIVEYCPEGIVVINSDGIIASLNDAAKNMFAYYEEVDFIGSTFASLFSPAEFKTQLRQNLSALKGQAEITPVIFGSLINRTSSEVYDVEVVIHPIGANDILAGIGEENQQYFAVYLRDVSVRWALQNQITQQANLDALTGLNNRRNFYEKTKIEFRRSLRHPYPICMLWVGIDLFKGLNEKNGTQAGDQILIAFSDMLRQHMRDEDIVARVAISDFAILLPHLSLSHAHKAGEKIRNYVDKTTVQHGDRTIKFTISVGVVLWNRQEEFDELLSRARNGLANAIKKGRNCLAEDALD